MYTSSSNWLVITILIFVREPWHIHQALFPNTPEPVGLSFIAPVHGGGKPCTYFKLVIDFVIKVEPETTKLIIGINQDPFRIGIKS